MLSKEEKNDSYWQGYIQKQIEAMEICKQCKYRNKANKYDSLVKMIKDKIEDLKENNNGDDYTLTNVVMILQELLKEVEE